MLAADAAAELEAAIARLRAVFDDRNGAARAADGIRKLAAWIPLTEEILEDAPTLRIGILLRMAGFGLARCDECGRRLRVVWTLPTFGDGWSRPRLLGATCYAKVRARGFGTVYAGGTAVGTLTEPARFSIRTAVVDA